MQCTEHIQYIGSIASPLTDPDTPNLMSFFQRTRVPDPTPTPPTRTAFPSRGKQLVESPVVWMREKAQADNVPPHLWRIRGRLLDLTGFMDSHPGVATWLKLVQGTDCTDEFGERT